MAATMHPQIQCVRVKLKPSARALAEAWAKEMSTRREEANEALRAEGMLLEAVFAEHIDGSDYLVYLIKAVDIAQSQAISRASQAPIELLHRQFKKDAWESVKILDLLLLLEPN